MAKDFQDIQQLDSEESDHQLGRGEEPGAHGHNPRREDGFWKGKYPVSAASLNPCVTPDCSDSLRSLSCSLHEQGLGPSRCEVSTLLLAPDLTFLWTPRKVMCPEVRE